jgi:uncharacterized tellurite resistance protein B-like protein
MTSFDLFQNIMVMAVCDGQLTEEEIAMLAQRANRWKVTDEQFSRALRYAMSPEAVISIPADKGQRRQLLMASVRMMAVDGELADIEKNLFAVVAATMKIDDQELNAILDDVLKN